MAEPLEPKVLFQTIIEHLKREEGPPVLALAPQALEASKDHPALRARVLAWLGQAEMFAGNYKAAGQAVRQAIALAQEIGDTQGVNQLKSLQAQVAMRRQAALAAVPPAEILDTPLFRADAAISRGDHAEGEALARQVITESQRAGNARDHVLGLLTLARVPGQAAESIAEAARVADESGDMNLVTAVARAAKAAGVEIAPRVF